MQVDIMQDTDAQSRLDDDFTATMKERLLLSDSCQELTIGVNSSQEVLVQTHLVK